MGIMQGPRSQWSQEMAKWECRPVQIGDSLVMPLDVEHGGRCINGQPPPFEEYPKAMYKAERNPDGGGIMVSSSQRADNEAHERQLFGTGWRASQADAIDLAKHEEFAVAEQAANRAWHEQRMSPKARAEAQAVEETSARHLGEIPEKPKRKYQKKTQPTKELVHG